MASEFNHGSGYIIGYGGTGTFYRNGLCWAHFYLGGQLYSEPSIWVPETKPPLRPPLPSLSFRFPFSLTPYPDPLLIHESLTPTSAWHQMWILPGPWYIRLHLWVAFILMLFKKKGAWAHKEELPMATKKRMRVQDSSTEELHVQSKADRLRVTWGHPSLISLLEWHLPPLRGQMSLIQISQSLGD